MRDSKILNFADLCNIEVGGNNQHTWCQSNFRHLNMAPKSKKSANAQKSKSSEEEREEPLQAVVFADSFETRFAPFTLERPRVRQHIRVCDNMR